MFQRKKKSLSRILQTLAAIGLLPLALFGAGSIWFAVATQRDELKRTTVEISRALASGIEAQLDAEAAAVAAVGRSPLLTARDHAAFYAFAQTEMAAHPAWSGMVLSDRGGRVIFSTNLPFGAADASVVEPDSLARAIDTGSPVVGALTKGPRGRFAFPVRVPVKKDGQVAYVLTAVVKPDWALDLLRKQNMPDDWVISVFDSNLRRVARSRNHESTVGGLPSPELQTLFRNETAERAVGRSRNLEGQDTFTGFARIKPHGWVVGVGAPTAIATATLARGLGGHFAAILLSALACILLAQRMAIRIANDVRSARNSALRLGEGHAVTPEPSHIVELDEMASAIGNASVRLTAANSALKEALTAAQQAGRSKDEFLAVLGHELRNPLAPMLTALHLMDLKGSPSTAKERQILKRQVDHMRRLVDDLLDVSRIVSGKLEIEVGPVNLSDIIERAVESLPQSDRTRIAVRLPEAPVWVPGDPVRLGQVLNNLLNNALRYGNGTEVSLVVERNEDRISLEVRDSGRGMSSETLSRVFEPFYQEPQPLERKSGGLGLGLAIVKSIVARHGGAVAARSAGLSQGSVFEVTLPTCSPPVASEHNEAPTAAVTDGARLLVVDDNVDALDTLVQALRMAGHTVQPALTPTDALAAAATFAPQVAILDIGLPGMDGYELAERLREGMSPPLGLIAVTGYGQSSDLARASNAGFDAHLAKPVEVTKLLNEVRRLTQRPQ